jgi:hypothetical protein
MSIKLTVTQLALLSAASQREDQYLTPPTGQRLGSAKKAAEKLLMEGLVQEVRARKDAPVWHDKTDEAFALKLTAAGLNAIADARDDTEVERPIRSGGVVACEAASGGIETPDADLGEDEEAPSPRAPRAGTKISEVIERLGREAGATIDEIVAATGWLPHTSRAALTGLRKRGYALVSDRSDRTRSTVYRIARRETSDEASRAAAAAPDRQDCSDAAPPRKQAPVADRRRGRAS